MNAIYLDVSAALFCYDAKKKALQRTPRRVSSSHSNGNELAQGYQLFVGSFTNLELSRLITICLQLRLFGSILD
jgi:hypothetical protein